MSLGLQVTAASQSGAAVPVQRRSQVLGDLVFAALAAPEVFIGSREQDAARGLEELHTASVRIKG